MRIMIKTVRALRQQRISVFTKTARSRPDAFEKMVKMLTTRIERQSQQKMPLSGMVIQEKVRSLYGDLTKNTNDPVSFAASHGWFERFKSCHAFHNLKLTEKDYCASQPTSSDYCA